LYDANVTMLSDNEATAEKVLAALDGAWLAHIAAYGIFRADSPLFSSLLPLGTAGSSRPSPR
jgi:hypothetical protein